MKAWKDSQLQGLESYTLILLYFLFSLMGAYRDQTALGYLVHRNRKKWDSKETCTPSQKRLWAVTPQAAFQTHSGTLGYPI